MSGVLKDRVAVITGATKGIGKGIAQGMAQAGANIVVVSRSQQDCEAVAAELEKYDICALPLAVDITKINDIKKLTAKTLERFQRIDILVNNAGTSITRRAEDITEEDWDRVVNLNLKSVFFCCQEIGRAMIRQRRGKIINIASILGIVGEKQVLPYCAAKGGVIQVTKALALDWVRYNIQVNALCPGYVMTSINEEQLSDANVYSYIVGKIPMRRLGEVSDMAGAAVFLASGASDYMTGQNLVIDGGWTAQ